MPNEFDVETYSLPLGSVSARPSKPKRKPRAVKGKFLKGPIPLPWLEVAVKLPGKTSQVAIGLWLAYGIERRERFKFSSKWHDWIGLSDKTLSLSLGRLQQAGLIRVEKYPGRVPIVTILAAPEKPSDGD